MIDASLFDYQTALTKWPENQARGLIESAPTRTRTWNLLIRSQILYPIELWVPAASDFLGQGWGVVKIFCRLGRK